MSRQPIFRAAFDLGPDEIVVDCFAGGGGASTGIASALQQPVHVAINHSRAAIAMHQANHPETKHYCEDILDVDPKEVARGRRIAFAWFSPDCTDFSRAKGSKPRDKEIRGLAWVVIRWAKEVRPRVIALENVIEFQGWGPLDEDGKRIKEREGDTFREWLAELTACGYAVQFRQLVAADYGAPTTRKRFFLIARCDGQPIVWPEPTHGHGRAHAWRPASEIIDWSLPTRSIFGRTRPLAEATMNRIAAGFEKYVLKAGQPFILPVKSWGGGGNGPRSIDVPMRTITASKRGEFALATPFVIRHGHYSHKTGAGLREGCGAGTFRGQPLKDPLGTVCATNDKHFVAPIITKAFGGPNGHATPGLRADGPLSTITAKDHHHLAAAWLTKFYGTARAGSSVQLPLPTVTSGAGKGVRAFLTKYYSSSGSPKGQTQDLFAPLHTITAKARFGLVVIQGEPYRVVDIGMRMLCPRELFGAQNFPDDYIIDPIFNGKPMTLTLQTELAGNSVPPCWAQAIVAANIGGEQRTAA